MKQALIAPVSVATQMPAEALAAPAVEPEVSAPVAPAIAEKAMPKVQGFVLPLGTLAEIAQSSGLQWVNSDAEKVAAVQAAIAAEPKPAHMPRERPPVVLADDGPLILVETRRDLAELKLPFEDTAPQR